MNLIKIGRQIEKLLNKYNNAESGDLEVTYSEQVRMLCDELAESGIGGILVNHKYLSTETYQFE